ncbi:TPA: polyphosphate kinase [Yersinia enterocolitica]|nr:polyphosphate kinase [Yersinia enterocolitica]HDL7824125.1 polyphosphate kinase [Yersinia enterocolitica]HDL7831908.1 polyphosphate kinase [Yersinia enterocolitica]HDL7836706.1 polyphosphate kinase [Yersinia enterocolitica]HDL7872572.1 polyphosphate kinase [Yersinia enterocolitica]
MHMLSKDKLKYPMEITDEQLRYLITAFENNMAEFYPVGREAEIARQLLSLREQLAELKALPPVAWRWRFCAQNVVTLDKDRAEKSNEMGVDNFTELFTAAKPAEIPRHIFSMLVNELRDVPAIGCKRELIIGVLNRHGVIAEPVQCDPPAAE